MSTGQLNSERSGAGGALPWRTNRGLDSARGQAFWPVRASGATEVIGERRDIRVGITLQHLSNAGIKEPNSGVNFLLVNASFPL